MRERNGLMSFFADRKLSTRIGAGFALVLLILAASSGIAWYAFSSVSAAVEEYASLVEGSAFFNDIDLKVSDYRGHVRQYVASGQEEVAAAALKDQEQLQELISTALARVKHPQRHQLLENISKAAESYIGYFARIHALNVGQLKTETEVMNPVGQQMTDGFTNISVASAADNAKLLWMAAVGRALSLNARLDASKRMGRDDMTAERTALATLAQLQELVRQVDVMTVGTEVNADVRKEPELIDGFAAAFKDAAGKDAEQKTLVNGAMKEAGDAMASNSVKAKQSSAADQTATEQSALSLLSGSNSFILVIGVGGIVFGLFSSWLIGRGISRPVARMGAAMKRARRRR